MDRPVLTAEPRTVTGKKVKKIRREGLVPAVVYGHKVEPFNIQINGRDFEKLFKDAGTNTICKLKVDAEDRNVLIYEPSVDPVSGAITHVDIYQVDMTEKITADVPIHFTNEAPAVRGLDGTLVTNKDSIEVECLPADLPHEFEVDLSPLVDFDAAIHVSDIKAPANVEVLVDPEEVIAYVEPPRSEEELAELEEAPEAAEEAEVIGEAAEEGEAGEEGAEGAAPEAAKESAEEPSKTKEE